MEFKLVHSCLRVSDIERSLAFYRENLHLREKRRVQCGQVTLVYLADEKDSAHELELNYLPQREKDGIVGNDHTHVALAVDNYEQALVQHQQSGCVVMVSQANRIHFIEDPDGHIIEVMPCQHFSLGN